MSNRMLIMTFKMSVVERNGVIHICSEPRCWVSWVSPLCPGHLGTGAEETAGSSLGEEAAVAQEGAAPHLTRLKPSSEGTIRAALP